MARAHGQAAVLVIGPLPPPVHGYAWITARMRERLSQSVEVATLGISPGTLARGWRYHGRRVLRVGHALWAIATRPRAGGRTLYLAIGGGAGVAYDFLLAAMARARGFRLFIHHHSFSYIER